MNRTENEIRNAFENATPNVLDSVLSHDCHEKGIVIPVTKRKFGHFMLRKILSAVITLLLIIGIVAVALLFLNGQAPESDGQVTIVEEDGQKYIRLPVSGDLVFVREALWEYLDLVDYDLLKAADEAIIEKIAPHTPLDPADPFRFLIVYEGEVCLYLEMIAYPDQTTAPGEDHIHVIDQYSITTGANIKE